MKIFFLNLFFIASFSSFAQSNLTPCTITLEDGSTIQAGIIGYRNRMTMETGIKVRDVNNKKLKIVPERYKQIQVGDDLYKSIINNSGDHRFMIRMVEGPNADLYLDTYTRVMHVPNLGMEMYINDYFYLQRGEIIQYVDPDLLKESPESYFAGAPEIIAEIKATKKKNFTIADWVRAYNEIELENR